MEKQTKLCGGHGDRLFWLSHAPREQFSNMKTAFAIADRDGYRTIQTQHRPNRIYEKSVEGLWVMRRLETIDESTTRGSAR